MGSALQRILSAVTVTHHISSCWMSLLQEGAGSVENHQSTKTLRWSLGGCWLSISSRFEFGTYRHEHSVSHFTSSTASVTVSGVSGAAAIRENKVSENLGICSLNRTMDWIGLDSCSLINLQCWSNKLNRDNKHHQTKTSCLSLFKSCFLASGGAYSLEFQELKSHAEH